MSRDFGVEDAMTDTLDTLSKSYASAILNAMADISKRMTGDPGIDMASGIEGMCIAFSTLLASHPDAGTPRGLRLLTEAVEARMRKQTKAYRAHIDAGGIELLVARQVSRP
jgi:hypothetical protein